MHAIYQNREKGRPLADGLAVIPQTERVEHLNPVGLFEKCMQEAHEGEAVFTERPFLSSVAYGKLPEYLRQVAESERPVILDSAVCSEGQKRGCLKVNLCAGFEWCDYDVYPALVDKPNLDGPSINHYLVVARAEQANNTRLLTFERPYEGPKPTVDVKTELV